MLSPVLLKINYVALKNYPSDVTSHQHGTGSSRENKILITGGWASNSGAQWLPSGPQTLASISARQKPSKWARKEPAVTLGQNKCVQAFVTEQVSKGRILPKFLLGIADSSLFFLFSSFSSTPPSNPSSSSSFFLPSPSPPLPLLFSPPPFSSS